MRECVGVCMLIFSEREAMHSDIHAWRDGEMNGWSRGFREAIHILIMAGHLDIADMVGIEYRTRKAEKMEKLNGQPVRSER